MSGPLTGGPVRLTVPVASFAGADPGGWDALFERARVLDAAGVDRLVVSDHVVFGEHLEHYGRPEVGGRAGGVQPTGPDGHWLEPLTTLAVLAGMTTTIRLGTNILLAALRRPVVLAKTAATLDVLSGGRLDLGVGIGWQREEYEAAGLEFDRRGRLLDHSLEVCRTLWREDRASYRSDELAFEGIHLMPKPLQAGGVPLWIAGTVNPGVVRRVARFGSGWIPWGRDADHPAAGIGAMTTALRGEGRDPVGLRVVGHLAVERQGRAIDLDATLAPVPAMVEAGITDFQAAIPLPRDRAAALDQAREVVAGFRAATAGATS